MTEPAFGYRSGDTPTGQEGTNRGAEGSKAIDRWLTYAAQMEFDHWISLDALEDLHLGGAAAPIGHNPRGMCPGRFA